MNQFNKTKVVMLAVKPILDVTRNGHYHEGLVLFKDKLFLEGTRANLYIISDDEIKEGDFVILKSGRLVKAETECGALGFKSIDSVAFLYFQEGDRKIIATTDTSLEVYEGYYDGTPIISEELPQLSQQFIEKYIESYNKGEIITDVLVEYENNYDLEYYTPLGGIECCKRIDHWIVKTYKTGDINIKDVKNSWNREEVLQLIQSAWQQANNNCIPRMNHLSQDKWIEKNL